MKTEDFKFERKDVTDNYEDYWFEVTGKTSEELTKEYMEQCMIAVTECVYSVSDNVVGVKRQFPFNFDVVLSNDEELKNILKSIVTARERNVDNERI